MSDSVNIGSQALLVSLSFGLCRQSRQRKREAEEVEERAHAQRGVVKLSSYYFQQANGKETFDALANIKSHMNAWRKEHGRLTRPWDQGNTRLLPARLAPNYLEMKRGFEEAMPEKVEEFMVVYADWAVTAPTRMGALFEASDFPSRDEVSEDISWNTAMIPLPTGEQFRAVQFINPNLIEEMERSTNEQITRAIQEAQASTWRDLIQPVQHIVEVLTSDKPRIFTSLIENLTSILALAPAFNLSGDAQMTAFVEQARATLATINPDDLRQDPELRRTTAATAQDLLSRFGALGMRRLA